MLDFDQAKTEYWSKYTLFKDKNAILVTNTLDHYETSFVSSLVAILGLTKFFPKNFFSKSFGWLTLTKSKLNISENTHYFRIKMLLVLLGVPDDI